MPAFISNFLGVAIRLLLKGKGQEFIEEYYKYVDKIYNYRIPLRDIAAKGKIKKSKEEYLEGLKEMTKAGRPRSRQAWYELAIKDNLNVHNGDTVYYINTGGKKGDSDVKKVVEYFSKNMFGDEENVTKEMNRLYGKYKKPLRDKGAEDIMTLSDWVKSENPNVQERERIIMNCCAVPQSIIDSDDDIYCNGDIEYNVAKYVEMFNKRITPLLVCFSRSIRDEILVSNPSDRKYFTEEQSRLVSGEPNNAGDQDTYEQLMTMEDKEIKFWKKYNLIPPFLEECHMGKWEDILKDYDERMEKERELGIDKERDYVEKTLDNIPFEDLEEFVEEGTIPKKLLAVSDLDPVNFTLVSKNYKDVILLNLNDLLDLYKLRVDMDDFDEEELDEAANA